MQRLIDATKLREEWLHNGLNEKVYNTNDFLDSIDAAPTIDAKPVIHSHWVWREGKQFCAHCSFCVSEDDDERSISLCLWPYCPNCGARMDEEV